MEINKKLIEDLYFPNLAFNNPINYTERIILYPVKIQDIFEFKKYLSSIIVRKNSVFPEKQILKMSYLEFLHHCHMNLELAEKYKIDNLQNYYIYAKELIKLVCKSDDVLANEQRGGFIINGHEIGSDEFDDIRRLIITQNDVDFDIDEFMHYEAEQALKKAQNLLDKDVSTIEDQIDSYAIATKSSDEEIMNLTIRKFGRYIKRINMYDAYKISMTASLSGMVTFKSPIKHWMISINKEDKFRDVKTDKENFEQIKGGVTGE